MQFPEILESKDLIIGFNIKREIQDSYLHLTDFYGTPSNAELERIIKEDIELGPDPIFTKDDYLDYVGYKKGADQEIEDRRKSDLHLLNLKNHYYDPETDMYYPRSRKFSLTVRP